MNGGALTLVGIAFAVIVAIGAVIILSTYFGLWLRAYVTRTRIGLPPLEFMCLRRVNPKTIVDVKVMAAQAGLTGIETRDLESHVLAGGRAGRVVRSLIAAHRARIDLDWQTAAAIDLAGRDVLDAVRMSVDPKVIDCPDPNAPGRNTLDGIAKDGIQLKVKARVTVRANLAQLVGGAAEETVVARVGEGIVSAIGSCDDHRTVLKNPVLITRRVLERFGCPNGVCDRLDRHCKPRRGRQRRRAATSRSGRGRHARGAGESRRTPGPGGRHRTSHARRDAGEPGESHRRRG